MSRDVLKTKPDGAEERIFPLFPKTSKDGEREQKAEEKKGGEDPGSEPTWRGVRTKVIGSPGGCRWGKTRETGMFGNLNNEKSPKWREIKIVQPGEVDGGCPGRKARTLVLCCI